MTHKLLFHSLPTSNLFLEGTVLAITLNVGFKMALKVNRSQKAQQEHEGSVEIAIQCNNTVLSYRLQVCPQRDEQNRSPLTPASLKRDVTDE